MSSSATPNGSSGKPSKSGSVGGPEARACADYDARLNPEDVVWNGDALIERCEGVDAVVFRPDGPRIENIANLPGFKFVNVGKFEERKATGEMIKAFDDEFAGEKDVWFVVSCVSVR